MDPLGTSLPSRRQVLVGTAALAATGFTQPSFADSSGFVSTIFGGVYEREYRKAFVSPFASANSADVQLKLGSSSEWLTNAKVNRRNPEIDMLLLPFPDSIRMTMEGLSIPLTAEDIPNIKDVNPLFYDTYKRTGVAVSAVGYGIAYRHDLVPSPITDWEDIWTRAWPAKWPSRRLAYSVPGSSSFRRRSLPAAASRTLNLPSRNSKSSSPISSNSSRVARTSSICWVRERPGFARCKPTFLLTP